MAALLSEAFEADSEGTPVSSTAPFRHIAHRLQQRRWRPGSARLCRLRSEPERGFGTPTRARKFFDIKCRKAGLVHSASRRSWRQSALSSMTRRPRAELRGGDVCRRPSRGRATLRPPRAENVTSFACRPSSHHRFTATPQPMSRPWPKAVERASVRLSGAHRSSLSRLGSLCRALAKGGRGAEARPAPPLGSSPHTVRLHNASPYPGIAMPPSETPIETAGRRI